VDDVPAPVPAEATQINSDSRFLSKHLHMPVMEPSTFQEIKDWIDIAFQLSGFSDLYVTYLVTTNQADGGATVKVRPHPQRTINHVHPTTLSSANIHLSDTVLIPPHTSMREATLKERHERFLSRVRELELNKIMEEMFNSPTPENIKKGQRLVNSFVYVLMRDPKAYLLLARLRSHDPYTLQHSVGTAVNCIILARKLGVTDEVELNEVGLAGLLHDIGKTRVPKEIINKEGPLTDPEWAIMKKHSEYGWELIKDIPEIPERTKKAVLEHHEDKKGTGYPGGKTFDQIDLFSKIACISDIFNALTTNRSYSKARDVLSALTLMKDKLLYKIDEDMFKKLVKIYGGDFSDIPAITPSERPDSVAAQAKPKKAG
jgi:putative nucleotidyltransferase with HDIG domain